MTYEEYLQKVVDKNKAFTEEEAKHDCEGCKDRAGSPCLKAYECKKVRDTDNDNRRESKTI